MLTDNQVRRIVKGVLSVVAEVAKEVEGHGLGIGELALSIMNPKLKEKIIIRTSKGKVECTRFFDYEEK